MSQSKKAFIACLSVILALIVISGCLPGKQTPISFNCAPLSKLQSLLPGAKKSSQTSTTSGTTTGPTRPHPPIRTGDITTGAKTQVASQTIDSSGGTIAVAKPGDTLDGFSINVPAKAYPDSRPFKVSSAPISKQTFGSDINPLSPMISVENGGGYSDEPMYVRVPVKVPDGSFAMGFLYDEKTKQLEGMPLVGSDAESVTVATMHFSNFFISAIEKALLKKDIDSGFRPGIDDWQFENLGSYIAPGGHCEGQSLSAMWYYCTQPDGKDMCLYGRYDNNGEKPGTPELWQDDSLGYRLCSVIQKEKRFAADMWKSLGGRVWDKASNKWVNGPGDINDEATFNLFVYSIRATSEPQEVAIWSNAGGGHSMVIYKVVGNALYVADPNYPGNTDRKIIFYSADGKFKPYQSGANKEEINKGNSHAFEKIMYYAKSTIVPWDKIALHWSELKNKTVGNDKFPPYTIRYKDDSGQWQELKDGYISPVKLINIGLPGPVAINGAGINVFRDGKKLAWDANGNYELEPGHNKLGVLVTGEVNGSDEYIDFKYFDVVFEDGQCKTPPPADMLAKIQKTTNFNCELLNLPSNIEGHGSMNRWVPGFKWQKHFYVPGNATTKGPMSIKWSGTSFSGGGSKEYPDKLTGNVCYSGGKLLVSFDYVTNDPKDNLKMSVKNVPCDTKRLLSPSQGGRPEITYMSTDAPVVKTYVTRLEWKSHEERPEYDRPPTVWDAEMTSINWTAQCGFDLTIY